MVEYGPWARRAGGPAQPTATSAMTFAPAPVTPVGINEVSYSGIVGNVPIQSSTMAFQAPVVSRRLRRNGIQHLFAYGARRNSWMRMIRTGGVESTKFQPDVVHLSSGEFNAAMYQAGHPRNLGLSWKSPIVPNELLSGTVGPQMTPRPRYTFNVFTRRPGTTVNAKPAQGTAS